MHDRQPGPSGYCNHHLVRIELQSRRYSGSPARRALAAAKARYQPTRKTRYGKGGGQ